MKKENYIEHQLNELEQEKIYGGKIKTLMNGFTGSNVVVDIWKKLTGKR